MKSTVVFALAALGLGGLSLAGCAHEVGLPDYDAELTQARFGDSVRQNIAAQTVNPDAPGDATLTASGARTAKAVEAYEEDEVEKPSKASTVRGVVTGGGGGGGGSSD